MGSMSSMISQTISQALAAHAPGPSTQLPVLTNPQPTIEPPAQETLTGVIQATHDSALRSRKRALPRQAERTRKWKCARAQTDDIDSDVESDMEAYAEASGQSDGEMESEFPDDAGPRPSTSGSVGAPATAPNTVSTLVDPSGIPLFDPDSLHHPRSAEWLPVAHVSDYLEHWVRRPLSKEARSKLRAECPRPLIPNKVCDTPSVDPKMTQFLAKTGWNPRKGLDSAIRSCQDKLLDIFGPLAKIFEMAESARADGSPIDPEELTGWIQRAICIAGSTNSSLAIERRKAILFKIDPKLANLALTESGRDAQGLLFGDSFIKDLSRYVGAFTALDKAQSSMRRVFQGRVSTRAGSSRGRPVSRPAARAEAPSIKDRPSRTKGILLRSFRPEAANGVRGLSGEIPISESPSVSLPPVGASLVPCVGGRLRLCFHVWSSITSDPWVLTTVQGFHIELTGSPNLIPSPPPLPLAPPNRELVDLELFSLFQKRAIERAPSAPRGVLSNIFLVQKKGGQMRPVINLRALNSVVRYRHFKMEGIHLLRDLLIPGDWMVKLDLKDAYLTVPIAASSRDLLRFLWKGEVWRFTCLPFGLSSAPWCFTKLLRPVVAWLRSRGVRLVIYLDDILIMHQCQAALLRHLQWTSDLLSALGGSGSGGSGGTSLVVRQLGSLERQSDLRISTGIHDRVGRESPGLGCPLRRCLHRGSVVGGREPSSHQRSGTPGGLVCHPQFLQWHGACLHPITYGQCVGGPLCQSPGRHPVGYLGATGEGVLVLLSLQGHHGAGGVPSGSTQRPGGSEFPLLHGRQRLEASAGDVLHDLGYLGPLRRGPLRVTAQYSPSQVLQLAPGSGGGGGGCVPSGLVFGSAIRVSSFRHDPEDAAAGSSSGCGVVGGDPLLGDSSMVPGSHGTPDGRASPPSGSDGSPPGPSGCSSPPAARRLPSAPGVPDLRTPGEVAGISEATRRLLDSAWAPGTRKSYPAAWGSWVSWCVERNLDPVSAPVTHLLQFLTSLFEAGKAYRTINLFRSAISSTHQGFDGVPAGQHPSVSRLLRGSRLARPPRPRFTTTWDVSLVLSFLSAWPENAALSLRQLSAKLLTLFCLISCKRVSDVRALDHDARSFSPEGVTFNITRRTKTNIRSVSYPCFPSSPALCPVACLREYESRTRTHRSADVPQLFLSIRHPFGPVSSPTLARWMKWVMSLSGIDTAVFTAHSARGAAATALAVSGARLEDILRLADWSTTTTFKEFYFRPPPHVFSSIIDQL
ncbi:uncharacterized protein LOC122922292 [Bufo gargarizans]|uniref:uncharacterized protein LOC122922292 n=1 Tax=Bufo gargarizans TaxID=30331 RepID=UPI001CF33D75|nr:uncharacterized protein LOC122922292 [Bufo gargarizans]